MSPAKRTPPTEEDSVARVPQTSPTGMGMPGHDFTLQAVMELQKSVGEMNATLAATKATVEGVKSKVDDLVAWKNMILGFFNSKRISLLIGMSSPSSAAVAPDGGAEHA